MENESVNVLMIEYEENVNLVAKIHTELCKRYGLEHYLTEFSSNLIRALNQYKRFVIMLKNKRPFVLGILRFSNACIDFFNENKDTENHHEAITEKMNELVKSMNEINEIINKEFMESVKEYM